MKLATRVDGSRDGRLLLVDPPLTRAVEARACATMLAAVADWDVAERELEAEHAALASGDPARTFAFDAAACAPIVPAPAFRAAGANAPAVHLAAADTAPDGRGGFTVAADLAAVTGPVPRGCDRAAAAAAIRAVTLVAATTRAGETTLTWRWAPVAVTPDGLDAAWEDGRVRATVELVAPGGDRDEAATAALEIDLAGRVAAAAASRDLPAGTVVALADPAAAPAPAPETDPDPTADPTTGAVRLDLRDGLARSVFGAVALA
jgi:fumarylacetoacetate (FAA) hydrolase